MPGPARTDSQRRHSLRVLATASAAFVCLLSYALVGGPRAQQGAPASSLARGDSCLVWREQAAVFRQAYRLRLLDLAQARRDSAVAGALWRARADSLAVELRWSRWQTAAIQEDRPRWYESHDAGFVKGLAVALFAVWVAGGLR